MDEETRKSQDENQDVSYNNYENPNKNNVQPKLGWSWGAFGLGWIWAIFNKGWPVLFTMLPMLSPLIPQLSPAFNLIALVFYIAGGIKGAQWAWENDTEKDAERFNKNQHYWNIAGAIWLGVQLFLVVIGFVFFNALMLAILL